MQASARPVSNAALWAGRIISGLVVVFMVFDGAIQAIAFEFVTKGMAEFHIPGEYARPLGIVTLACTALYAVPRTALLGAVLLTGYLGGAMAVQLRVGNPLFSHVLFGGYLGVALWLGLMLRSTSIRALLLGRTL